ncbi:class II glutamine amidotransferase [Streptomyces sp. NPDC051133]|uniref:class II glutamine amidotransferase n=1 Tax=Streptomyces sp. NPDC051133 TaxID=3155521 RepID=UPI003430F1DA
MCRLLGVVGRNPRLVNDLLTHDLHPFLALADEHKDGWGMGLRSHDNAIRTVKDPARGDGSAQLQELLHTCTTDIALLHLRMASQNFPVTPTNTHPFGDTTVAFAHNGDFTPSTALDGVIGTEMLATAEGDTDSERFYLAIRRRLNEGLDPAKAILQTAADIRTRAEAFVSLNCLLLTPDALFAYTEHDPHSEVIGRRGPGYFGIHYRQDSDAVVVASTGWPHPTPEWNTLPEYHVLQITPGSLDLAMHSA